jgi:two-component system response regulator (stage 0 sporulation protein F)
MNKNLNILVADDEEGVGLSLAAIFGLEGHNVVVSENGIDTIKLMKQKSFDIAFFDIRMPLIDGVEVLKEVRKFDTNVVIVMMTAYSEEYLKEEAIKQGAIMCIDKPYNIPELLKIIRLVSSGNLNDKKKVVLINADYKDFAAKMTEKGYSVLSFSNMDDFLRDPNDLFDLMVFETKSESISEIKKLALKLKEKNSKARFIVIVDYSNPIVEMLKKEEISFIRKPFDSTTLLKMVEDC